MAKTNIKTRPTAKRAKPAAKTVARRKSAAKTARTPVAAVAPQAGAKTPTDKVAAAIALALRPEGVSPQEVMETQGWHARASERHLIAWGKAFGYSVRAERDAGRVRFHMAPAA